MIVITTVIVIDHDLLSGTEAEIEARILVILSTRRRAVAAKTAAKVPESLTERSRSGFTFLKVLNNNASSIMIGIFLVQIWEKYVRTIHGFFFPPLPIQHGYLPTPAAAEKV